ncbi:uncharacterized protein LOC120002326 [Tripterygium wilfordii]|uniref:uncharacterized protein LOC119985729 n=1 Tax=Tripterygium wilfordii TaxID=458696 RepID=UPI0018F7E967|nr:uncharacterized protein LOC119985729 [Tripterygium wilfordii]XP_038706978.1 uncharacterized protein LOC120002326 [Tripterygium wilfordii]
MAKTDNNDPEKSEITKMQNHWHDDPSDPLYLHHSDQPGLILVTQSLNQENYPLWSHAMLMALIAKNKDGFIDGTVTKPVTGSTAEVKQWTRCDLLVKGWILNTVTPAIGQSVMYNDSALAVWNELKELLSTTNSVYLFHIEQEIHDCLQGNMTIGEYYTKLKSLWDKRDALCPLPPCSGDIAKTLHQYQQTQRTIKFLMGLNEVYAAARGQILLMDPLPPANKVFSLVNQDEKQRVISSQGLGKAPEAAAFTARERFNHTGKAPLSHLSTIRCHRCHLTGHSTENCRAHLKCDYCGHKGHTIDICRKLKRANSHGDKSNHLNTNSHSRSKAYHVSFQPDNTDSTPPSYNLTADQYHDLLALIDQNKVGNMASQVNAATTMSNVSGPTIGGDDWDGN